MKRLIFLLLALLVAGSASAATKVQVMTDGKIDVDKLPTITFKQDGDPANATDGQLWYNNATNQIKVRDGGMVYHWNATGSAEYADAEPEVTYLIDEDFESSDALTGWTVTGSGFVARAASTGLSMGGDYVLRVYRDTEAEATFTTPVFEGVSTATATFRLRMSALPTEAGGIDLFSLLDGESPALKFSISNTGTVRAIAYSSAGGAGGSWSSSAVVSTNESIYVKLVYEHDGTDAVGTVYTSANGSAWTEISTATHTGGALSVDRFNGKYLAFQANDNVYIDDLQISEGVR